MSSLCYVQARGGSKRFPMKALALWNGIPMLGDAIQKAQATGLFDYIVVSSDSPEILQVAHDYGAMPLWRTAEASSDTATDTDVARETLRYFPAADYIMKLYPCVPLLTEYDIRSAFDMMRLASGHGIYGVDAMGVDSGSFYIFKHSSFITYDTLALDEFPWMRYKLDRCQDINVPGDLEKARMKAGR